MLRLVPYSGIQICEIGIAWSDWSAARFHFIEESFETDGVPHRILLPIEDAVQTPAGANPEEAGDGGRRRPMAIPVRFRSPLSGKTVDPATILTIDGHEILTRFGHRWAPVPYLRFIGRDQLEGAKLDRGPTDWVRAFIVPPTDDGSGPVRIALAFDTSLHSQSRLDGASYVAPSTEDAEFGSTFFAGSSVDDVGPVLAEGWIESWLTSLPQQAGSETRAGASFQHRDIAMYLSFLRLLAESGQMPEIRFSDTVGRRFPIRTVAADLVLDIGDTETTALLVDMSDSEFGESAVGAYAEPLLIRELSNPLVVQEGSFPTAAEFSAAPFGDASLSRDSGRLDGFQWPSLVRIGHEARRLALRDNGTEGVTGLSNLRSFLLDDVASPGLWRQSTDDGSGGAMAPMVSGTILDHIGENGALLGSPSADRAAPIPADQNPAIRPKFSRASMIGFFASELVLHAIIQLNAMTRAARDASDTSVRALRHVVVLPPASFSQQEREALASRVEQGVALVWRGLGWDKMAPGIPTQPAVSLGVGGELGTQIAFLHNEVTAKYQGRFRDLLRVYRGGEIAGSSAEALRVASIDIGARSSSLTIVDFAAGENSSSTDEWRPNIVAQDRLPVGTDAIRQAFIWTLLLPAVEAYLSQTGLSPARHFLEEITGRSATSLLVEDPYFTRRLNRKIMWPAASGLLALEQHGATSLAFGNRSAVLKTLVELGGGRTQGIAAAFDAAALQAGARSFSLDSTNVGLKRGEIGRIIHNEMRNTIYRMCDAIGEHRCDLLLLCGEGNRLTSVSNIVLEALPVPASRIIDLNAHTNQAALEAIGGPIGVGVASILPLIATALERRHMLEASGFQATAIRRIAHEQYAENSGRRALSAPQSIPDRHNDISAGNERPYGNRTIALPSKGA